MKRCISLVLLLIIISGLTACSTNNSDIYVIKTYEKTSHDQIAELLGNSLIITTTYYELSDGTWKTDDYTYKYRLVITGRLHNAVNDSMYVVLSNIEDITFEQAWKAGGLSSNTNDYFDPKEAIIVERTGL